MNSSENNSSPPLRDQISKSEALPTCSCHQFSKNDSDTINLLDYLEVLARHWRMIISVTIVAAILSTIISFGRPDIYSSTAMIIPPQQDSSGIMGMLMGGGNMGGMAADLLGKGTTADMYVGILSSEALADKIIDRFNLVQVYEQKFRLDTYKVLDKKVNISAGKKNGIISISVEDEDPKRSTELANAYVEELGRLLVRLNIIGAGQNRSFYEEQLAKAKIDLAKAEDDLKRFHSNNKLVSITDQAQATIGSIAQLKAQLALQEVQLATLRQQYTDNNQDVINIKASIANLRTQIGRLEGRASSGATPGVEAFPDLAKQNLRLLREFKIQETLVELLTKQYEMAKLSESKDVAGVQVLQSARVPDRKIKPNRSLIVLIATFTTGLVTILYAFICEALCRMPEDDRKRWHHIKKMILSLPMAKIHKA